MKKKYLSILLVVCLIFVGTFIGVSHKSKANVPNNYKGIANGSSWMSSIDGNKLLSQINIPGAHDAATCNVQLSYFSQCQDKSISSLLNCGFRYLDMRLDVDNNALRFFHGSTSCLDTNGSYLYLDSVLNDCYTFLDNNPTETILFVVKQEKSNDSLANFQILLNNYIQANVNKWLLTNTIPSLNESRGKIVLFRRYSDYAGLGKAAGIPLLWNDQGNKKNTSLSYELNNSEGLSLCVQDRYAYSVNNKWTAFTNSIYYSQSYPNSIMINFLSTSGSGIVGSPAKYAKSLNSKLLQENLTGNLGWIVVDFGTEALASHIYNSNF